MVGGLLSEVLAFAPDSATLIALSVVLPVLFLFYVHYSVGARRCRSDFSLSKLRRSSCSARCCCTVVVNVLRGDRSVCCRLERVGARAGAAAQNSAKKARPGAPRAGHLRARSALDHLAAAAAADPRHCKTWIHVVSARFAVVGSLACYSLALAAWLCSATTPSPRGRSA